MIFPARSLEPWDFPNAKDRPPGPRGVSAEEFELDPSITAAGGTTMVMAPMALVTWMQGDWGSAS